MERHWSYNPYQMIQFLPRIPFFHNLSHRATIYKSCLIRVSPFFIIADLIAPKDLAAFGSIDRMHKNHCGKLASQNNFCALCFFSTIKSLSFSLSNTNPALHRKHNRHLPAQQKKYCCPSIRNKWQWNACVGKNCQIDTYIKQSLKRQMCCHT